MAKKLSLTLAMAVVAALASPAFAAAVTGLTEGGALVPTGYVITGTNSGSLRVTSTKTGTLTCAKAMIQVALISNSTSLVEGNTVGESSASSCTNASGAAVTFKELQVTELRTTGGGTGATEMSFGVTLPSGTTCRFFGNGNFTYSPTETSAGGNVITITKQPLGVTPAACGISAELDGVFKLSTSSSTSFNIFLM